MVSIQLPLKGFTIPNFVLVSMPLLGSSVISNSIPIGELDDRTVKELLHDFETGVWAKVHAYRARRKFEPRT